MEDDGVEMSDCPLNCTDVFQFLFTCATSTNLTLKFYRFMPLRWRFLKISEPKFSAFETVNGEKLFR